MISNEQVSTTGTNGNRLGQSESAFPLADHGEVLASGLTKRELFAVMAMQGLLAQESENWNFGGDITLMATSAVKHADALIAALSPPPKIENIPWANENKKGLSQSDTNES